MQVGAFVLHLLGAPKISLRPGLLPVGNKEVVQMVGRDQSANIPQGADLGA